MAFLQKAAGRLVGGAGKALSNVGYALRGATGANIQLQPGGLGQRLQDIGGQIVRTASAQAPSPIIPGSQNLGWPAPVRGPIAGPFRPTPTPTRTFTPTTTQTNVPQAEQRREEPQPQQQGGGGGGESDYDIQMRLAREKQEEAERVAQERIRRYGEVITPLTGDIETYLKGRPDLKTLFESELKTQGVPGREATLSGFEKDVANLQGQLSTIPGEEITRRRETGMLSAAAERRIRQMEERPIREQLLKSQGAVSQERVGLQRAYDIVDKILDITREQERRGLEPLTTRLEAARGEFTNEVDALAQRLTGFNQARTDQLAVLKAKIAADVALSKQEQQQAFELQKLEIQHINEMEKISARQKNQPFYDKTAELEQLRARVQEGATSTEISDEFQDSFDVASWEKILEGINSTLALNNEKAKGGLGGF